MEERELSAKGRARREAILETAMGELAANGYGGISVRAVARAMGLEPAHILYYFGTREAMLEAVIDRWDVESEFLLADPAAPITLDVYADAVAHNLARPGVVHLYLAFAAEAAEPSHRSYDYFSARFARVHAVLADAIRAERRQGTIAGDVDPDRAAQELIALADGMQLQALVDPAVDAPGAIRDAIARLRASVDAGAT